MGSTAKNGTSWLWRMVRSSRVHSKYVARSSEECVLVWRGRILRLSKTVLSVSPVGMEGERGDEVEPCQLLFQSLACSRGEEGQIFASQRLLSRPCSWRTETSNEESFHICRSSSQHSPEFRLIFSQTLACAWDGSKTELPFGFYKLGERTGNSISRLSQTSEGRRGERDGQRCSVHLPLRCLESWASIQPGRPAGGGRRA